MAHNVERGRRDWIAFLAGAVAMLAIALAALAGMRMRETGDGLRARVALPHADLPSLPDQPPPDGLRPPRLPLPAPR